MIEWKKSRLSRETRGKIDFYTWIISIGAEGIIELHLILTLSTVIVLFAVLIADGKVLEVASRDVGSETEF